MRKCYILLAALLCSYGMNAQVGINTNTPSATLDVQKSTTAGQPIGIIPPRVTGDELRLNANVYGAAQNGAIVYVTTPITAITEPKSSSITSRGLFIYDAEEPNGAGIGSWQIIPDGPASPTGGGTGDGAYAARMSGNLSVLNLSLGLLSSNARFVRLPQTSGTGVNPPILVDIPTTNLTNIAGSGGDSYYTVPSTGIYQINYSYRTGQGLSLQALSSTRPGIIIAKSQPGTVLPLSTSNTTTLDFRYYGGLSILALPGLPLVGGLSLANISLTQGQISHIYQLSAGEQLRFGIVDGGLSIDLLADASAEISIYKIK
ncbi:hypothetical protein [Chryseobacterium foetidum]|uniref:hypothetical protein n=1 Tax=Chryseobacterium foetidum TaxID=2951057 RepID=UPI0021C844A0|nr:hypothetical protein [Chryseobacterium foetidum]